MICPNVALMHRATKKNRLDYWARLNREVKTFPALMYPKDINIVDFLVHELGGERSRFTTFDDGSKKIDIKDAVEKFDSMGMEEFFRWVTEPCEFSSDYPGYHMNWWTFEKVESFMREAGFEEVAESSHCGSIAGPFHDSYRFDREWFAYMSLYVEAYV